MSHYARICQKCGHENHHHGDDCGKCHGELAPETGSAGWGLWHRGRKKWCNGAAGRAEYGTRAEAVAAKLAHTRGKRDTLTNYFRAFVSPRRLPNAELTG